MHFIKQTLIPHKHNQYRPHLIRRHGLAFALMLILGAQVVNTLQLNAKPQVLGYATNINVSALLSGTNAERSAAGKKLLSLNSMLNSAAQAKANHMIANNYWAHTSPDGITPWYWFDNAGYEYLTAGENLAYGFDTSAGVITGWMNSPSHRDNMLNNTFKEVGFGIANGSDYQGSANTVVVAMYGDPAVLSEPSPAPAPPSPTIPTPTSAPISSVPDQPQTFSTPAETQPIADKPVEPIKPTIQPTENNETLAEESNLPLDINNLNVSELQVKTEIAPPEAKNISNLEAILTGQASWSLYFISTIALLIGFVYSYRHVLFIHGSVIKSERYLVSHPMLEAGIIYAIIWLILAGSFGSVL